jgi:hypothetical protein
MFKIPENVIKLVFPSVDTSPLNHLAYVEWFTPIPATPDPVNGMYKVSRLFRDGARHASIIPVKAILCSVHLFPRLTNPTPMQWVSSSVLEHCQTFYVNPFSNRNSYLRFA